VYNVYGTHKANYYAEKHGVPCSERLQRRGERKEFPVVALCFHSRIKAKIGQAYTYGILSLSRRYEEKEKGTPTGPRHQTYIEARVLVATQVGERMIQTGYRSHVGEPTENFATTGCDTHISEQGAG
jgi:hypothetical protein